MLAVCDVCPCCSGRSFGNCCGPFLLDGSRAPTAERLMRSRYAAYALHDVDYLEATLLPEERASFDRESARVWSRVSQWMGLEILSVEAGAESDETGVVEFIARYRQKGRDFEHYEKSRFVSKDGTWYYVDGTGRSSEPATASKTGRNGLCPCGSGKKYKKCCGGI